MKALVLAGGSGTRLLPITHTYAKQLVPIANKPVLFYVLEAIQDAGVTDVGMVVGETEQEIRGAVDDSGPDGLRITYIRQEAPLGLAHAVLIAREYLAGDDFVMYLGDNFLIGGITELVKEFKHGIHDAQILLTPVAEPRAFGVAELDETGRVIGLEEKPSRPKSDLALVGVYMFGPLVHEAVRAISPSRRGELEITDAIQWLLDGGHSVRSHIVNGYWKDTGRPEDMLECNRKVLESVSGRVDGYVDEGSQIIGEVIAEEGSRIERSVVRGPVVIGRNTRIVDSYIGPYTSVQNSCLIEGTELEYSIVMDEATIRGATRIENSLIGRRVRVVPSTGMPTAHRLVLGDHSQVSIA